MTSALSKLKLSSKTRPQALTSPEARIRQKVTETIAEQIRAAEAELRGEVFTKKAYRYITDPETGENSRQEVPGRFRKWWFKDETGVLHIELRYGNKRVPLKTGKTAVEVGDMENLVPTLQLLLEAVSAGELDKPLLDIKTERALRFGPPAKREGKAKTNA